MRLPFPATPHHGLGFSGLLLSVLLLSGNGADARIPKDGVSGRLPIMGWNSWNAYRCEISERQILEAAEQMAQVGLRAVGYTYVIVDDCWSEQFSREEYKPGDNSSANRLMADHERFPSGMKSLGEELHQMGYKFGIYSSAGDITCAGYPGSLYWEEIDAETFASWGVDYLKYDNCGVPASWAPDRYHNCHPDYPRPSTREIGFNQTCLGDPYVAPPDYDWGKSSTAERFYRMRDALERQDRTILLSLCEWGQAGVTQWGNDTAISWRISDDIFPTWHHIKHITDIATFTLTSTDFFGHADADMLEVGNGNLTIAEQRTHFAVWAAIKSPLLIGSNIGQLSDAEIRILENPVLIRFNQDPVFGRPAFPFYFDWIHNDESPASHWAGRSTRGTLILLVNWDDHKKQMSVMFDNVPELPKGPSFMRRRVIDGWTGQDYGCLRSWSAVIAPHDTAVLLVQDDCRQFDLKRAYGANTLHGLYGHNTLRAGQTKLANQPWTQKSPEDQKLSNCTMTVEDTPCYDYLKENEMPDFVGAPVQLIGNKTTLASPPPVIHAKNHTVSESPVPIRNAANHPTVSFQTGRYKQSKKSEPIPEPSEEDDILQRVVADNFQKQVISNTKDILLFAYVPSKTNITYDYLHDLAYELGSRNQENKTDSSRVRIGLVDLSANDIEIPKSMVSENSTVLLYPGDKKEEPPIQFPSEKEMTLENLVEFLAKYGAHHQKIELKYKHPFIPGRYTKAGLFWLSNPYLNRSANDDGTYDDHDIERWALENNFPEGFGRIN